MANWHGYFGIESLSLTDNQRNTLVKALRRLGPGNHSQPCKLCHWRVRPDGLAAIFEAEFDEDHLTIAAFKNRLATIFNVSASNITHATTTAYNSPVVTFKYNNVNQLRLALFGGTGASWEESRTAAVAYLAANREAWEAEEAVAADEPAVKVVEAVK